MYSTPEGRKKAKPGERLRQQPVLRPAGHLSDYRAVGALCSLRALAATDFKDIAGCWGTELLQEGELYRESESGQAFLCLGYSFQTAFMWRTSEHSENFFQLSEQELGLEDSRNRFCTVSLTEIQNPSEEEESPWKGIPTKVCSWTQFAEAHA